MVPIRATGCLPADLDGLVQVGALQDVEPGDLLLGLGERAVADQHLAATLADRGGVADRPEPLAQPPHPAAVHLGHPGLRVAAHLRALLGAELDALVHADQQHVPHRILPW
jgi:hypothetical protein